MSKVTVPKKSLWEAIRKMCLKDMSGSTMGVRECPSKDCPLYPFRMGRRYTTIRTTSNDDSKRKSGLRIVHFLKEKSSSQQGEQQTEKALGT